MKSLFLHAIWLSIALTGAAITGCGDGRPKRVPVSGSVLIDGQPLKFGFVRFIPQGARASGGALDENGRFRLGCFAADDGAVAGTHRVEILSQKPISDTKSQWLAPKKYAISSTSGLTYEVTGPTENATFNLTWDGGKPFFETVDLGADQERSTAP